MFWEPPSQGHKKSASATRRTRSKEARKSVIQFPVGQVVQHLPELFARRKKDAGVAHAAGTYLLFILMPVAADAYAEIAQVADKIFLKLK